MQQLNSASASPLASSSNHSDPLSVLPLRSSIVYLSTNPPICPPQTRLSSSPPLSPSPPLHLKNPSPKPSISPALNNFPNFPLPVLLHLNGDHVSWWYSVKNEERRTESWRWMEGIYEMRDHERLWEETGKGGGMRGR